MRATPSACSWLIVAAFVLGCCWMAQGQYNLALLHTGDVRARLDPIFRGADCPPDTDLSGCTGGVARRASRIQQVESENTNVMVVDSGNLLQGSVYYYLYKGQIECGFYEAMNYRAMSLDTRELYDGPQVLADFLDCANFAAVSANADYSQDHRLSGHVKQYEKFNIGGEEIGFTGFVTQELQQRVNDAGNVTLTDPVKAVRGAVLALLNQGVNKIVVVCSEESLLDDLVETVSGIDIIILNTQTLFESDDDDEDRNYPTEFEAPDGSQLLVVAAGKFGEYLGELYVTFNSFGVITSYDVANSQPFELDSSVIPDTTIANQLAADWAAIETSAFGQILGTSTIELPAIELKVRRGETRIGNLVADSLREEGSTQIAILNAGTLNTDGDPTLPKNITLGALISVGQFLFSDTLSTLRLPGHAIVKALENGVSRINNPNQSGGTGRFPLVSGLRFSWNKFEPPFKRVIDVWVDVSGGGNKKRSTLSSMDQDADLDTYLDEDYYWDRDPDSGELRRTEVRWEIDERGAKRAFVPISPNTMYTVTTGSYLRDGNDGYDVIPTYAQPITYFGVTLDIVLIDYLALYSPVTPMLEGRIIPTNETQPNVNSTSSDDDGEDVDVTLVAVLTSLGGAFGCMALFAAAMVVLFLVQTRRRNKKRMRIQLKEPNFKELTFAASYMLQEMEQKTKQRKTKKKSTVNRKPTVGYTHIFDEIKPSAARLDIVEQLALDLNFVSALNVVAAPMQSTTALAEALVYAHSTNTRSPGDVVLHLLLTDLHGARDQSTLLREDTLGASAFKTFSVLVGLPYLWHTFAYTFAELELQAGEKEEERMRADTSGGSNSSSTAGTSVPMSVLSIDMHNVEINEEHLNDDTDATVNKLQLLLILQKLFNQIVRSLPSFPKHLKYLCYQLREANPYPDNISKVIGALVFLRFLCPAFIVPHQFGLMKAPPPSGMQRLLILITKVMQNLANHVRFGEKEKFMIKMNEFIESNITKIDAFFQRLAEPIAEPALNDPPSMVVPKHVRKAALYKIDTFIQQHGASILRALGDMDDGDVADAMSRLTYLMQDTNSGFRAESTQPLTSVILEKDEDEVEDVEAGKQPDSSSDSDSSDDD